MSLDTPANHVHAAMVEDETHPAWESWEVVARRQEAAEDATREAEWRDREACESEDAIEAYWIGVAAATPDHIRRIRYEGQH